MAAPLVVRRLRRTDHLQIAADHSECNTRLNSCPYRSARVLEWPEDPVEATRIMASPHVPIVSRGFSKCVHVIVWYWPLCAAHSS